MLDFVWHLRGSISLEGAATSGAAIDGIERLLMKQGKPITEIGPSAIGFDDPLWNNMFGPNWLAMVIYDRGRFWIEQSGTGLRLRYELRSLHGMVFCLFGSLMFFVFGLASGGLADGLEAAALAFGWLYGMNILLALLRVPQSIRKAVRSQQ